MQSGIPRLLHSAQVVISRHNTPVNYHVVGGVVLTEQDPVSSGVLGGEREVCSESLVWTVRLSDGAPHKKWVVLAVAVIAGVSGAVLLGQVLLGFVGFAMILASTAEYWLGVQYKLDSTGASRRCGFSLSAIDWADVKRVVVEGSDVLLSPLPEVTRMDVFRGVVLKTTPDNREQVLSATKRCVGEDVRLLG